MVINGKEYKLRFGYKAMLEYEKSGKKIANLEQDSDMSTIAELAYCAIVGAGQTVKRDDIIDAIDADLSLIPKISEALEKDMTSMAAMNVEAGK